eukprot:Em0014g847a
MDSRTIWLLFVIIATSWMLYGLCKLKSCDPGTDTIGRRDVDGTPLTIVSVARQDRNQTGMGTREEYSFCVHCEIVVGAMTKHCKLCGRCVSGFDHHCVWLMLCVGCRNHRLFILFILSIVIENFLFIGAALACKCILNVIHPTL